MQGKSLVRADAKGRNVKGGHGMKRRNEESESLIKKRKWVLPVVIVACVVVVILIACLILLGVMSKKGLGFSKGRYLATRLGSGMVILDDVPKTITDRSERERYLSPVVMSNRTERDLFKNLEDGDEILIVHGAIKESYPGGTGVYAVFKLKDGSIGDIPQRLLKELVSMGYLDFVIDMDADFPDWGLTLSVKDVTPTGLTLVCTQNGGSSTGRLTCGTDYRLLVSEDGKWKNVPTVIEEYGWDDMGYRISEGKDTEFELSWEWLYGTLPTGIYRLTKEFSEHRGPGDYDKAMYWVEFEIKE